MVYLGDDNLRNVDPIWLRDNIGLVSQEPILFACSIYDNIQYGCDATRSEVILQTIFSTFSFPFFSYIKILQLQIEEAARQANAHEFITSFSVCTETTDNILLFYIQV